MAKDRLPELQQRSSSWIPLNGMPSNIIVTTIASATVSATASAESQKHQPQPKMLQQSSSINVDAILNPYSEIRTHLAQIAANLESMNRMVQTTNIKLCNENEMDVWRRQNLRLGNQLMNKFLEFKNNLPPDDDYSLEARMKRTLFYGLYQSYVNLWTRNEEFLQYYENKLKKNLQFQSRIVNCNATDEEIEELIANRTTSLFMGNILEETEKERRILRDLMDRFNELKKLEKSIEEVHALFIKIQTLVLEQSETIQRVEFHAQQASMHVDKGAGELSEADKLHKKAFKKKILLIVIAFIIVTFFILIAFCL